MSNIRKKISTNDFKNNEYIMNIPNASTLSFQGNGAITYSVQCNINDKENWSDLSLVNLSDFSIVTEVSDNSTYVTTGEGIDFIKIKALDIQTGGEMVVKAVNN